jgi:hypothetical protein
VTDFDVDASFPPRLQDLDRAVWHRLRALVDFVHERELPGMIAKRGPEVSPILGLRSEAQMGLHQLLDTCDEQERRALRSIRFRKQPRVAPEVDRVLHARSGELEALSGSQTWARLSEVQRRGRHGPSVASVTGGSAASSGQSRVSASTMAPTTLAARPSSLGCGPSGVDFPPRGEPTEETNRRQIQVR